MTAWLLWVVLPLLTAWALTDLTTPRLALCDECSEPVHDDDMAPSCGAHRLHIQCRDEFRCRWCDEEWQEATSE